MKFFKYFAIVLPLSSILTGCTQPIRIGEKPDQPPAAVIIVECSACQEERSGVAPLTVIFDASSSKDDHEIVLAHWKLGDSREATGMYIEQTFDQPGKYFIELTVYDQIGQTSTARTEVTVLAPPPPEFRVERAENDLIIVERVIPNRTLQVGETVQFTLRVIAKRDIEYIYWREILPYALSSPEDLEFMLLQLHKDQSHEWVYNITVEQSGASKLDGHGRAAWLANSTELTLSSILEVP
jgi:hypothetical protein